jgi:hypothetical protein
VLDHAQLSGIGALVTELRSDTDLATLVGRDLANRVRVRGGEPVGSMRQSGGFYAGDARGAGDYQAFVVLVTLDEPVRGRVPIFDGYYGVNAYGSTFENARAVWGALVKAMHFAGGRTKVNGLHIYTSIVETGGTQDIDPVTQQPVVRGTIHIVASANAVA